MANASPLTDMEGEVGELTEEVFGRARPASEVLPEILGTEEEAVLLKHWKKYNGHSFIGRAAQHLSADNGYAGEPAQIAIYEKEHLYVPHIKQRGEEIQEKENSPNQACADGYARVNQPSR